VAPGMSLACEPGMAAARPAISRATLRLGRIRGIPLGLHYSWFMIAGLITLSLAGHFRVNNPDWTRALIWSVSALTAVLFFVTLLLHELSHAVVAQSRGVPVRSITLFALGGLAQIEKDASSAKDEFAIAVVGPIASFAIGAGCLAVAMSLGWTAGEDRAGVAAAVLGWLGTINLVLAGFNLIPAYPLDGGRILRAILWGIVNDARRATRYAAGVGQAAAGMFIAWGVLQFFSGSGFGALWLVFIGWFVLMAAQASYAEAAMGEALRDVRVADVMANDCATVDGQVTVQSLVDEVLLRTGRRCVLVKHDGRLLGLITPQEIRTVDRACWAELTVGEVMRPLDAVKTVDTATPVTEALAVMAREDVNQLPVVADGRLEGIVTRAHIIQLLQARAELKAA
jgi:Zn-dependent protease/predicted transcriptional regulator